MLSTTKSKPVVGLDVEAGSIAAVEVASNGHRAVGKFGIAPLGPGVVHEGEVADPGALGDTLKSLFSRNKLSRTVRVGIASQRVAVRTLRLPRIDDPSELETAIRFQAKDQIPMPLEQAALDWQIVGHTEGDGGGPQVDVIVVAARREMLTGLTQALSQAGLRPVGVDLSAFGMIRALVREPRAPVAADEEADAPARPEPSYEERLAAEASDPAMETTPEVVSAHLYCNLGDVTNLAVARGATCLFTRVSTFGLEGIAQKLAERRQLSLEHARQWLVHVGLENPVEAIEGDAETITAAREALGEGAARLVDELRLSLEYYAAQDAAVPIEGVVTCGPGTTIPGLTSRLQRDLGLRFEEGRPQALAHLDEATAARLTLSFGLGLEE
jgi:type IV pilus assembly protein PilM